MTPKPRNKENKGLPKRWRYRYGAYYYCVPKGQEHQWDGKKEFNLGKHLHEAYKVWSDRLGTIADPATMSELMDRYLLEIVPAKSYSSQQSNQLSMKRLRPVVGKMKPAHVKPSHAYQIFELVKKKNGLTSAKHDIQCLRHLLTKAVQWGVIDVNPLLGQLRMEAPKSRDRLIEDWEIDEALSVKGHGRGIVIAKVYVRFKLMTGLRRGDILRLSLSDIKDDGIHVQPNKTKDTSGKRLIFQWDAEGDLRGLVDEILGIPPRRIGNATLFTTRQGKPYIDAKGRANGFDSLWQRFMDKVMETSVSDRFQERDLRAKVASDSATEDDAQRRLAHADPATTRKIYRRKPVTVLPLIRPTKS